MINSEKAILRWTVCATYLFSPHILIRPWKKNFYFALTDNLSDRRGLTDNFSVGSGLTDNLSVRRPLTDLYVGRCISP